MPTAGEELGAEKVILRLVRAIPRFVPEGKSPLNGEAFEPTTEDKAEAERRSLPVRASVWDLELTTVEQAKTFRGSDQLLAFTLTVQDVNDVRHLFSSQRLKVVADPLLNDSRPGAIGHCGIEGLDRQRGEDRQKHRAARDELAHRARLIEEPPRSR